MESIMIEGTIKCISLRLSYRFIKRFIDLSIILILIPFLIPIVIIICSLIKIFSRGPVIFTQQRLGKGGKPFKIYKFRTMYVDAEERLNNLLDKDELLRREWIKNRKLKHDPRIFKFGKFLRKTSLDEIPQFINVLKGEMSLVGPRPYLPHELDEYKKESEIILSVLPGITGLWQTNGRSNTTFRTRVKIDCLYIKKWSIWLDFKILVKTLKVLINCEGAY